MPPGQGGSLPDDAYPNVAAYILQANGPGAAQSVFHTHFHIIPRHANDGLTMNWGVQSGDIDEIKAVAQKIRAELEKES